jgi:CheY-like chemotaxis protein/REP element-mobilizing transposase RayT
MSVSILVVTSSAGFGELIEQVLLETGHYAIARARNAAGAMQAIHANQPALVILDCNSEEGSVRDLVDDMRAIKPDVLLVMIPPTDDENLENLEDLHPEGFLSKPFFLPDMIETVEEIISEHQLNDQSPKASPPQPARVSTGPLPEQVAAPGWLGDVNLVAQHLTRLTLESASQAALITKADGLWAYAGELPQEAAEELTRAVAYHFSEDVAGDLARYVRLETIETELMLYATSLGGEFVLAMVFDAEMPFSRIRTQASDLAKKLSDQPAPDLSALEAMDEAVLDAELEEALAGSAEPLWEDVPSPNLPDDWLPQRETAGARENFLDDLINDRPLRRHSAQPHSVPVMSTKLDQDELNQETLPSAAGQLKTLPEYIAETMVSRTRDGQELDVTAPSRSQTDFKKAIRLAPADPILYDLTYACVLVPRMPDHYLTGELTTRLSHWVTQLALAFGWRLEQLAIRPEYLQWMANVPPKTSPGYLMRIMRDHTSRRIFTENPRFAEENPSGDFWAPGYLIMASNQSPPQHLITEFIKETRNRQGAFGE